MRRIAIHRSFRRDVYEPLASLVDVEVRSIAQLEYDSHAYPLLCVESGRRDAEQIPILISGGVHGDEPAGVYAAVDFLRHHAARHSDLFHFIVFPCVNPSGFEANTLETMDGVNLNRSFGTGSTAREVQALETWLADANDTYRATFDLHEAPPYYVGEGFVKTDNPTGTYLYETVSDDSPRIGSAMIADLPQETEVCDWPAIYEDRNDGGVVAYPEACGNPIYAEKTSLDAYLNGRCTGHSFTTETPTFWSIEKRVETQLSFIRSALRRLRAAAPVAPRG